MKPSVRKTGSALAIATAIAVPAEGLRQYAYYDPPGILTVCYGHTGNDVEKGRKYSLSECRDLLSQDMAGAIADVERCVPGLPDHQLAAFADAVYNLGPKIVCDKSASSAARLLAAGAVEEACTQLLRWNKARVAGVSVELPGLTKRRKAEYELCIQNPEAAPSYDTGSVASASGSGA